MRLVLFAQGSQGAQAVTKRRNHVKFQFPRKPRANELCRRAEVFQINTKRLLVLSYATYSMEILSQLARKNAGT